jgi:uncharacterized membrane protein YqaE (UPF0057 family)
LGLSRHANRAFFTGAPYGQGTPDHLVLAFPFLAVLIHDGPCMKVVWAFLLQLLGHIPGVIYGIYQVTPRLTSALAPASRALLECW